MRFVTYRANNNILSFVFIPYYNEHQIGVKLIYGYAFVLIFSFCVFRILLAQVLWVYNTPGVDVEFFHKEGM